MGSTTSGKTEAAGTEQWQWCGTATCHASHGDTRETAWWTTVVGKRDDEMFGPWQSPGNTFQLHVCVGKGVGKRSVGIWHAQKGYCYCYFIFSSKTWKILLESDEILQVHLFSWHEPMHASKSCTVQTATHQVWGMLLMLLHVGRVCCLYFNYSVPKSVLQIHWDQLV